MDEAKDLALKALDVSEKAASISGFTPVNRSVSCQSNSDEMEDPFSTATSTRSFPRPDPAILKAKADAEKVAKESSIPFESHGDKSEDEWIPLVNQDEEREDEDNSADESEDSLDIDEDLDLSLKDKNETKAVKKLSFFNVPSLVNKAVESSTPGPSTPKKSGKNARDDVKSSNSRVKRDRGTLREVPCLRCVRSFISGKGDRGRCYNNTYGSKRCYNCVSGHSSAECMDAPERVMKLVRKLDDAFKREDAEHVKHKIRTQIRYELDLIRENGMKESPQSITPTPRGVKRGHPMDEDFVSGPNHSIEAAIRLEHEKQETLRLQIELEKAKAVNKGL